MGEFIAKQQLNVCRFKLGMLPWHRTNPTFVGGRKYCVCGTWGNSVATKGSGETVVCSLGLINSLHDVVTEQAMCKKLNFQCKRYPYQNINMIGLCTKIGKKMVSLCVTCSTLALWSSRRIGTTGPDCGYHDKIKLYTCKYNGTPSFSHHGLKISTPEAPDRLNMEKILSIQKKIQILMEKQKVDQYSMLNIERSYISKDEELMYKIYLLMDKNYRKKLQISRINNVSHCTTLRTTCVARYCIYCMSYVKPGSGAAIWVVVNGLKKEQDKKNYNKLCQNHQKIIHRIPTSQIYKQLEAVNSKTASEFSFYKPKDNRASLQLVYLCPVDLRNARRRIIYDITTIPFIEDLYRWIDASERRKTRNARKNKNMAMKSFRQSTITKNSINKPSIKFSM